MSKYRLQPDLLVSYTKEQPVNGNLTHAGLNLYALPGGTVLQSVRQTELSRQTYAGRCHARMLTEQRPKQGARGLAPWQQPHSGQLQQRVVEEWLLW